MLTCENCGFTNDIVMIKITDGIKTIQLCPNCVAGMFLENKLSFLNNPNFIDDITGRPGAVKFESYGEEYCLERRVMMRLISHNLRKTEYLALAKKYGADKYMLHDDFYYPDGTAVQPLK